VDKYISNIILIIYKKVIDSYFIRQKTNVPVIHKRAFQSLSRKISGIFHLKTIYQVSRTFGDIEAKLPKFGGIRDVVSAIPEIV
jgi:hypothetical protein